MKISNESHWMKCSGDFDGKVPFTSTQYSINVMKLHVKTKWHPWYLNDEEVGPILFIPKCLFVFIRKLII